MKNGTQGASVGVSGARLFQELVLGPSGDLDFGSLGVTWWIVGVILESVGCGRGPQIEHFGGKDWKQIRKMRSKKQVGKT